MLYRSIAVFFVLTSDAVFSKTDEFVCPKDGRWPHPTDCERYYTCNTGISIEGWCGSGMSYDPEHKRCDLTKNIECENGERPSWTPPEEWGQKDRTTVYFVTKTSSSPSKGKSEDNERFDDENEEKAVQTTKRRKSSKKQTTIAAKRSLSRSLVQPSELVENSPCHFQDQVADPDDCRAFFSCNEEILVRNRCPDRQLFDEDNRQCSDFRKVFCDNRPTTEFEADPCLLLNNGWFPEVENQCRTAFLCNENRKSKLTECSGSLKWNSAKSRCDDPRNIVAPCGLRPSRAAFFSSNSDQRLFVLLTLSKIVLSFLRGE